MPPADTDPDDPADNIIRLPDSAERAAARKAQEKAARRRVREPFLNLPPVTFVLLLAILVPQAAMAFFLDPPAQYWVLAHFGFVAAWYGDDFPGWPAFVGPLSYMLLHGGWLHAGMNAAMLAAFGAGVERWLGGRSMAMLYVLCGIAGAAFHAILFPGSEEILVGASAGVSGLFSGVLLLLHARGVLGHGRFGIWPLAAFWMALAVFVGLLGAPGGGAVAWDAHVGGFLTGFALLRLWRR